MLRYLSTNGGDFSNFTLTLMAVTAHTLDTGAMLGCARPGARVWLRRVDSATRKYPLAWELAEAESGVLVGINAGLVNLLAKEAIETGLATELQGFESIRTEVRYGNENSRIDLLLEESAGARCYAEVKNVTLVEAGRALFPDAVTARGAKHLRELAEMVRQGHWAAIFYCVRRCDAASMGSADRIDPAYGLALRQAMAAGVEALAYQAEVTVEGIALMRPLPVICPELSG
jgi:sugar fermentation stimulation protein A